MNGYLSAEEKARRHLALAGYRIRDGAVYWIADDDPEQGISEVKVGEVGPSIEDTYLTLSEAGWPKGPIQCSVCWDIEVAEIGALCEGCSPLIADEARAEMAREAAEETWEKYAEAALDHWDRNRI